MTILDLIRTTTDYFTKHQVDSPRLTIELLLADLLQKKRMQLYLEFDRELTTAELDRLRPLVKKRAEGYPLQHLTGFAEFCGHRYKVTPDVLIPRPETEILVEALLQKLGPEGGKIIDVGTGSGILALTFARKFPQRQVLGIDISLAALAVARENGTEVPNVEWVESDLLQSVRFEKADLIVANLPYLPSAILPTLSREVQKDPRLALDGGSDGLDLVRRLIPQTSGKTNLLALELAENQAGIVRKLLLQSGYPSIETVQDLNGVERFLIATIG